MSALLFKRKSNRSLRNGIQRNPMDSESSLLGVKPLNLLVPSALLLLSNHR